MHGETKVSLAHIHVFHMHIRKTPRVLHFSAFHSPLLPPLRQISPLRRAALTAVEAGSSSTADNSVASWFLHALDWQGVVAASNRKPRYPHDPHAETSSRRFGDESWWICCQNADQSSAPAERFSLFPGLEVVEEANLQHY